MKYFRYVWYLIRHKWYVMVECFRMGLYWRGLTHDLSKFYPSEFFAYMNWFSDDAFNAIRFLKTNDQHSLTAPQWQEHTRRSDAFDRAWLHHQHCNPHHWQYWILRLDDGRVEPLEMPDAYLLEMVCDWIGAGKAITGKREVHEWYEKNKHKMMFHPVTQVAVENVLKGIAK